MTLLHNLDKKKQKVLMVKNYFNGILKVTKGVNGIQDRVPLYLEDRHLIYGVDKYANVDH